jgi:hypothetical protein
MTARRALASALSLALCLSAAPALASGMRPWFAPDSTANSTTNATMNSTSVAAPVGIPDNAEALAQYQVLREYFERQTTLDDRLPEVFSRRVRDEESVAFLTMRAMVARRGQLERFRMARVDLSGLTFTRVTADPDLARIRVTGSYSYTVPPVVETVEEDALFVLLPEMGRWKIFERREGWRP